MTAPLPKQPREYPGRSKGAIGKKTFAIAHELARSGNLTPLEVMLHTMHIYVRSGHWPQAAAVARDAAPYVHPRLAAMLVKQEHSFENMTDAELIAAIGRNLPLYEAQKAAVIDGEKAVDPEVKIEVVDAPPDCDKV